mgnify:CR=1 FL=1
MSLEIETKQAVAALQAAAKECGDVLALCDNKTPETTEGRGYAYIAARLDDGMRVINNVLKDIGEAPSLPAARAPETVVETETVTETVTVDNPETQQRLDDALAKIEELERVLAEAAKPHPAEQMLDQMLDTPPDEVAELIHEGEAYGDAQNRLQAEYNELTHLIEMKIASPEQSRKQGRLHGAIDWLKRKAVETV